MDEQLAWLQEVTGIKKDRLTVLKQKVLNKRDWRAGSEILSAALKKKAQEPGKLDFLSFEMIRNYFARLDFLESKKSGKAPLENSFNAIVLFDELNESIDGLRKFDGKTLWNIIISDIKNDEQHIQDTIGERILTLLFVMKYGEKVKALFHTLPILEEDQDEVRVSVEWWEAMVDLEKNLVLKYLTETNNVGLDSKWMIIWQEQWVKEKNYPGNFYTDTLASLMEY